MSQGCGDDLGEGAVWGVAFGCAGAFVVGGLPGGGGLLELVGGGTGPKGQEQRPVRAAARRAAVQGLGAVQDAISGRAAETGLR